MYDDNKLWEGHRIILPGMREKAVHCCGECRFFVRIRGVHEVRKGCVVGIKRYRELWRLVPGEIPLAEILSLAGKVGLPEILIKGDPLAQACGEFRERLK